MLFDLVPLQMKWHTFQYVPVQLNMLKLIGPCCTMGNETEMRQLCSSSPPYFLSLELTKSCDGGGNTNHPPGSTHHQLESHFSRSHCFTTISSTIGSAKDKGALVGWCILAMPTVQSSV